MGTQSGVPPRVVRIILQAVLRAATGRPKLLGMPYLVRFEGPLGCVLSDYFDSFQAAHAYARENQKKIPAGVMVIAELDECGRETNNREVVKL
jgi:hypothetical protein